jgi:hypothetical protein
MANVTVHSTLMLNTGELVDLSATLTEGTEGEVTTSTTYSVSAVSLGQFADGKTITSVLLPVTAPNGVAYAYIDRRGEIAALLPVAIDGEVRMPGGALGFTLQAGDTVRCLASTAANRTFAYSVKTNQGVCAIFTGLPAGAADTDLTHIKSGQGLGTSLVGQSIVMHQATSVDGSKLSSGGVLILNDRGLPVGGCPAVDPGNQQPSMTNQGGASIALNFVARVTTNA